MEQMNGQGLDTVTIDYEEGGWPKNAGIFRPLLYRDGNAFCCILGPDPQAGVFGCGDTALEAVIDWDNHLNEKILQGDMSDPVTQYLIDTKNISKNDVG